MKKLVLIVAFGSAAACIEWPTEAVIQERFCTAHPTDAACADAGARPDAGGVDAGSWRIAWSNVYGMSGKFLVGDQSGGTLIGQAGGNFSLHGFTGTGPSAASQTGGAPSSDYTAAYEREGTVVIAAPDGVLTLWSRGSNSFTQIATRPLDFVTTAVDLYRLEDAGLAVAAYGNADGGLAVESFTAETTPSRVGGNVIPCSTSELTPKRILPSPDGGPGVVVGTVNGSCPSPFLINVSGGGFVARFGSSLPNGDGYSFPAQPNSPMALGIVLDDLAVAYQLPGGNRLALAKVTPTSLSSRLLLEGALTPVSLVDVGDNEFVLVGHGSNTISLLDGGARTTMNDEDLFIARINSAGDVVDLRVFVAQGSQIPAGAVWTGGRLVIGGGCSGLPGGLCTGSGQTWIAGFEPVP